jgi:hypothetical protein
MKARIESGQEVTMQEIVGLANEVAAAQAMDPKKMAADAKWCREHCVSTTQSPGDAADLKDSDTWIDDLEKRILSSYDHK